MSLMKDRLRTLMRSAKNSIKDYSPAERRVRAATSNEPWPPSSRMMTAICRDMTDPTVYDSVLVMILKRLQDKGQVMHVRKTLQLIEFCLRHGNSRFIEDMKTRRYIFKALQTYRFLIHGQDKGAEIRAKAEQIMNLLADDVRLDQARLAAKRARSRMQGFSHAMVKSQPLAFAHRSGSDSPSEMRPNRPPRSSTHPNLPSPSSQTSSSDPASSSTCSASSDSKEVPAIEPPRKKTTDKSAKAESSDPAAARNRGGRPAIPDNPFDPLSSLFDSKSPADRAVFDDWIPAPATNENDNGNVRSDREAIQTATMNGGVAAAPQRLSNGGSGRLSLKAAEPPSRAPMMTIDSMIMASTAATPGAQFANPDWYQLQPYRPMPQQQQLVSNRARPTSLLALPPPVQDPQNPFL